MISRDLINEMVFEKRWNLKQVTDAEFTKFPRYVRYADISEKYAFAGQLPRYRLIGYSLRRFASE